MHTLIIMMICVEYNFSETEVNKASQHYTGKNWNQLEGKEYTKAREYITNNLRLFACYGYKLV